MAMRFGANERSLRARYLDSGLNGGFVIAEFPVPHYLFCARVCVQVSAFPSSSSRRTGRNGSDPMPSRTTRIAAESPLTARPARSCNSWLRSPRFWSLTLSRSPGRIYISVNSLPVILTPKGVARGGGGGRNPEVAKST